MEQDIETEYSIIELNRQNKLNKTKKEERTEETRVPRRNNTFN